MSHLSTDDAFLKRGRRISRAGCEARGAVNGLVDQIIETHVGEHVASPDLRDTERAQGAGELIAAISRYAK